MPDYDYQADDSWIPEGHGLVVGVALGICMWAMIVVLAVLLGAIS